MILSYTMPAQGAINWPSRFDRTIPSKFFRVIDDESFVSLDDLGNFDVGYSTRYIALEHRITAYSVKCHLSWSMNCDSKGLISVCGTCEKAAREVSWRTREERTNICVFEISTTDLQWTVMRLGDWAVDVLTDASNDLLFIRALDLVLHFDLHLPGQLQHKVLAGAADEWLAFEWIPKRMIREMETRVANNGTIQYV